MTIRTLAKASAKAESLVALGVDDGAGSKQEPAGEMRRGKAKKGGGEPCPVRAPRPSALGPLPAAAATQAELKDALRDLAASEATDREQLRDFKKRRAAVSPPAPQLALRRGVLTHTCGGKCVAAACPHREPGDLGDETQLCLDASGPARHRP